jgi:hypothetical protein
VPSRRRLQRLQSVPESSVVEAFPRVRSSRRSRELGRFLSPLDAQRPPGGERGSLHEAQGYCTSSIGKLGADL